MVMRTARMMPQLETGPQKWVVFGPTGLFWNALNAADMAGRSAGEPATMEMSSGTARPGREAGRVRSCGVVGVRGEESDGWDDGNRRPILLLIVPSGGFGSNKLAYGQHRADCAGLRVIITK